MNESVLKNSHLQNLNLIKQGKVRDIYDVNDCLLIVASDRISAFDVVMDDPIPDKGSILTQISLFWFDKTASIIENHLVSSNPDEYPESLESHAKVLKNRSMLVKKAQPLPVECIVRGYLAGSGWKEYRKNGSVCGIPIRPGMKESEGLENPIFTPSTKAEQGMHDENISFEATVELLGEDLAEKVKDISIKLYEAGRKLAYEKGIIVADTKFEFGIKDGRLILIDEILTPDSSRFWPVDEYRPGGPQKSFDKQFLRDYLSEIGWDKRPPAPRLPAEIITMTKKKYMEAYELLTGNKL